MEFLIAAAVTCSDISAKIERVNGKQDLSPSTKAEIVKIYKTHLVEATGLNCTWDAKAD
tara:strand:+ start:2387 stop:2563 length:177 start_codon:yes stop_codon:yes gene_type:complete